MEDLPASMRDLALVCDNNTQMMQTVFALVKDKDPGLWSDGFRLGGNSDLPPEEEARFKEFLDLFIECWTIYCTGTEEAPLSDIQTNAGPASPPGIPFSAAADVSAPAAPSAVPQQGPGRASDAASSAPPKRKPGRPRKEPPAEGSAAPSAPPEKKRRGRPRKPRPADASATSSAPPEKKRRGRPPKKPVGPADAADARAPSSPAAEANAPAAPSAAPKTGPGQPSTERSADASAPAPAPQEQKKRGRPPKKPVAPADAADASAPSSPEAEAADARAPSSPAAEANAPAAPSKVSLGKRKRAPSDAGSSRATSYTTAGTVLNCVTHGRDCVISNPGHACQRCKRAKIKCSLVQNTKQRKPPRRRSATPGFSLASTSRASTAEATSPPASTDGGEEWSQRPRKARAKKARTRTPELPTDVGDWLAPLSSLAAGDGNVFLVTDPSISSLAMVESSSLHYDAAFRECMTMLEGKDYALPSYLQS
ncbi:hypothetical protein AURDEDRAFT_131152 [Auricularia subglabra TFB-10046 SS5]|uniref:Zn(2)-C6 fungal-type domain-containing protein n=1 Tax=Auricularia subglabra (strain TFB-10046 / SS5) TaxID=717982 RepID=J0WRB0_AURST|nr:hypothetical protein AURDEDRAFT_131152 [Auricularia subglabra TFB-10046 SS5]